MRCDQEANEERVRGVGIYSGCVYTDNNNNLCNFLVFDVFCCIVIVQHLAHMLILNVLRNKFGLDSKQNNKAFEKIYSYVYY